MRDRSRGFADLDRNVEEFEDAAESDAAGEQVGVSAEHDLNGTEKAEMVGHEGDQSADGEVIVDDELAAIDKDDGGGGGEHRAGEGAGEKSHHLHGEKRIEEARIAAAKFLGFAMLAASGDDEAHGEQAFDEKAAEVGAALAKRFGFGGEATLVVAKSDDTDGQQRDAGEKESPVERGHDDEATDQEKHVGKYGEQRVGSRCAGLRRCRC